MTNLLQRILPTVQKPARYTGGEYNQVVKPLEQVDVRIAFCFPDTYELGMSNLGMRILYGVMNEMQGVWCERVFAPWGDMEAAMQAHHLPLWALESQDPVRDFDMIAFTIGYEMSYSNVVNMLRLSQVPIYSRDRQGLRNLVFAGGVCAFNPEPLADFVDFFSLGEGEESTVEIVSLYQKAKKEDWTKDRFLEAVSHIPGVYVPSFYTHTYRPDGTLAAITPREGAPRVVTKRIVEDLDRAYFPTKTMVPTTEIVHDRSNLEVFRGCIRGCRFCQAGFSCRPVRKKSPEVLYRQAVESLTDSGNHELTLASLSTSDYRGLKELTDALIPYCMEQKVNLSVPLPAGGQLLPGAHGKAPDCAEKRPHLCPRGRNPAAAGRDQQEPHGRGNSGHLRPGFLGRVEQCQALLHAGPAYRDRRGRIGHCGAGVQGHQNLASPCLQ